MALPSSILVRFKFSGSQIFYLAGLEPRCEIMVSSTCQVSRFYNFLGLMASLSGVEFVLCTIAGASSQQYVGCRSAEIWSKLQMFGRLFRLWIGLTLTLLRLVIDLLFIFSVISA